MSMRTLIVVTLVLLALLAFTPQPAAAQHVPCFSDYDHGITFQCEPDASDPLCIEWFFGIGVAKVCPRDLLP